MSDHRDDLNDMLTDPDPVRRAQIQMQKPAVKRFYKEVTIGKAESGGHAVLLDGRSLKTPAKNTLSVPTAALAALLRAEWDAQGETVEADTMPVTRLVNTAIDGVSREHRAVFDEILRFAGTDMLCYRADQPEGLVARQAETWDPILDWIAGAGGAPFVTVPGIMHQEQPRAAIAAYAELLRNYATPWPHLPAHHHQPDGLGAARHHLCRGVSHARPGLGGRPCGRRLADFAMGRG